ncbi:uncharacterized protein V1516DRAFT_668054 [Lipomyces oligophaga]|uniref:uncharacterized protein n=1 Tax=Lipomyces oligophaga TaxID=45792 RepID=UPI0034CE8A9F
MTLNPKKRVNRLISSNGPSGSLWRRHFSNRVETKEKSNPLLLTDHQIDVKFESSYSFATEVGLALDLIISRDNTPAATPVASSSRMPFGSYQSKNTEQALTDLFVDSPTGIECIEDAVEHEVKRLQELYETFKRTHKKIPLMYGLRVFFDSMDRVPSYPLSPAAVRAFESVKEIIADGNSIELIPGLKDTSEEAILTADFAHFLGLSMEDRNGCPPLLKYSYSQSRLGSIRSKHSKASGNFRDSEKKQLTSLIDSPTKSVAKLFNFSRKMPKPDASSIASIVVCCRPRDDQMSVHHDRDSYCTYCQNEQIKCESTAAKILDIIDSEVRLETDGRVKFIRPGINYYTDAELSKKIRAEYDELEKIGVFTKDMPVIFSSCRREVFRLYRNRDTFANRMITVQGKFRTLRGKLFKTNTT